MRMLACISVGLYPWKCGCQHIVPSIVNQRKLSLSFVSSSLSTLPAFECRSSVIRDGSIPLRSGSKTLCLLFSDAYPRCWGTDRWPLHLLGPAFWTEKEREPTTTGAKEGRHPAAQASPGASVSGHLGRVFAGGMTIHANSLPQLFFSSSFVFFACFSCFSLVLGHRRGGSELGECYTAENIYLHK